MVPGLFDLKHTVSVNQCQSIWQSENKTSSKVLLLIIEKLMNCILRVCVFVIPGGHSHAGPDGMCCSTGCLFVVKLCDRVSLLTTVMRLCDTESKILRGLLEKLSVYSFGKIFIRQVILLGQFLCDRV